MSGRRTKLDTLVAAARSMLRDGFKIRQIARAMNLSPRDVIDLIASRAP